MRRWLLASACIIPCEVAYGAWFLRQDGLRAEELLGLAGNMALWTGICAVLGVVTAAVHYIVSICRRPDEARFAGHIIAYEALLGSMIGTAGYVLIHA